MQWDMYCIRGGACIMCSTTINHYHYHHYYYYICWHFYHHTYFEYITDAFVPIKIRFKTA